jgi:ferredoxin-fold anticodon binding domain-containing protein
LKGKYPSSFGFNLKRIDPNKDYVFTEQLKHEVEVILKANKWIKTIDSYVDEKVDDVFEGYTIDPDSKYLMYPYSGFRFNCTVAYPEDAQCLNIWE